MNEQKPINELIKEQLEQRALTPLRLQQMTGIPERYLDFLIKGEYDKMPAMPYVRGYVKKIAEALGLNGAVLWERYKKELELNTSGEGDRLPANRFAIKAVNKKWLAIGAIGVAVIIYLLFNVNRLIGQPTLSVSMPSSNLSVTSFPAVNLAGQINPKDTLFINNQETTVDADGKFEKTYALQSGLNTFEFVVKRFLGRSLRELRQVIYQPPQ